MYVSLSIRSELLEGRPLMAPSMAHFTGAQEEMSTTSTSQVVREGGGPAQLSMEELGRGLMSLHWGTSGQGVSQGSRASAQALRWIVCTLGSSQGASVATTGAPGEERQEGALG